MSETTGIVIPTEKVALQQKDLWLKIGELLGAKLKALEELLQDFTASDVAVMQEMMEHLIKNRGKRLRPILLFLCGGINPAVVDDYTLLRAAAAVELIHSASLIHDDIIDGAEERRGKPSLNALWGNHPAVLAGDFLFARSFELIASCGNFALIKVLTRAVSIMCEGEIEQGVHAFDLRLTEQQYLHNIYRKTAALMEACCSAGARLAGLTDDAVLLLEAYGRNLGLAFQITDDVLDITGEASLTGKPVRSDLREGIITLPLIYLLEDPVWGSHLSEVIEKRDFSSATLSFLDYPDCIYSPIRQALARAAAYIEEAKACLSGVGDVLPIEILKALADFVLEREY